jgi:hypothetical protein
VGAWRRRDHEPARVQLAGGRSGWRTAETTGASENRAVETGRVSLGYHAMSYVLNDHARNIREFGDRGRAMGNSIRSSRLAANNAALGLVFGASKLAPRNRSTPLGQNHVCDKLGSFKV